MYPTEGGGTHATPLIIAHYLIAACFLLAAALLISSHSPHFIGHHFQPTILSVTHLLVLGFVSMVIFGALLQLLPVLLKGQLYSTALGYATLLLLALGSSLLSYGFHTFRLDARAIAGGSMVLMAAVYLSANVLLSSHSAASDPGTALLRDFINTAMLWLLLTVALGLMLLLNLRHAFLSPDHLDLLRIHAHMGMAGWFLQLVMGVGSRLLPMFMVAHGLNDKPLKLAYYSLNAGLITALIDLYLSGVWFTAVGALMVALAVALFMAYVYSVFRKRVKRKLDLPMRLSMRAFASLPLVFLCVIALLPEFGRAISERLSIAYGGLYILGFLSALVLGQSYKTLPFIIWLRLKKQHPGQAIPLPATFYDVALLRIQSWAFAGGLLLFVVGLLAQMTMLISGAGIALSVAALCYLANMLRIVFFPLGKVQIPVT